MAEYGSFGQVTYDKNFKNWHFEQHIAKAGLQQLGDGLRIVSPSAEPGTDRESGPKRLEKQSKALVQSYPELQPASGLLADLARISEAVEDASARYDPMKGDRLAFGSISDQTTDGSMEFVAFPTGPTGSDLRVVQLKNESRNWDASAWFEVPVMSDEEATWKGPGVPIQSITFAQSVRDDIDAFLAVGLPTETVFFRLMLVNTAQPSSSKIEVNLNFRLLINDTGDMPYAHVAFNPWAPRQFAFIDQAGSWTVREMDEGEISRATLVYRDHLADDPSDAFSAAVDDGWGRIVWVAAPTILAICNRRKSVLVDFEKIVSIELPGVATVLDDGIGWNLDLAVVQTHPDYLFLLTTAHIILYHVSQDDHEVLNSKRVLCFRHFRNTADLSLRLHVFQDDNGM